MNRAILRESPGNRLFVSLTFAHALTLVLMPALPVIAIGMWWNANTIAHNFIHRPFFRRPWMNAGFSAILTLLIGVPQRLWRDRHVAHHAGREFELSYSRQLAFEGALLAAAAVLLFTEDPLFAAT